MHVLSYCSLGVTHDGWEKFLIELDDGEIIKKNYRYDAKPWNTHFGLGKQKGTRTPKSRSALIRMFDKKAGP